MLRFDWKPDKAFHTETPIICETPYGGGYHQRVQTGVTRVWHLGFTGEQNRLSAIREALESNDLFFWTEPDGKSLRSPRHARRQQWGYKAIDGELREVTCEFVVRYDGSLFGEV